MSCIWPWKSSTIPAKAKSPQTNGIVERPHKTMLNEFYRIAFRKKIHESIDTLQTDLDAWLDQYTTMNGSFRDAGATARHPCAPSSIHWSSPGRNSFPIDPSFSIGPTTCQIEFRLIHLKACVRILALVVQ